MRILGIDPGTRVLGYGMIGADGARSELIAAGVVRADARSRLPDRLLSIRDGLRARIAELRPDAIAIERAFHGKNSASLIALGEGRGVALLCAAECGAPIFEYTPAEVKKAVSGRGGARKAQIASMVRALLGAPRLDVATDATDALAIALCHAQRRGVPRLVAEPLGEDGPNAELLRALLGRSRGRARRGRGR